MQDRPCKYPKCRISLILLGGFLAPKTIRCGPGGEVLSVTAKFPVDGAVGQGGDKFTIGAAQLAGVQTDCFHVESARSQCQWKFYPLDR
jgi:hypothetical protein